MWLPLQAPRVPEQLQGRQALLVLDCPETNRHRVRDRSECGSFCKYLAVFVVAPLV